MGKLKKVGSDIWFNLEPGENIRFRQGPNFTWFGPRENLIASRMKAISSGLKTRAFGAGIKNRAVGLPLIETDIAVTEPTKLLARVGTKVEIWELELDDQPVYFKGAFYLGHRGDITLKARKLNFNDFIFMVEPGGTGTVFLAFPKNILRLPLNGGTICTPNDTIALIMGEPNFENISLKKEAKDIFSKGGWTRNSACEISNAEEIYIYGGSVKSLFSSSSDEEVA